MKIGQYRKFIVALIGFLTVVVSAMSDGNISVDEQLAIGVAGLTALGVYQAPNDDADEPAAA